MGELKKLSRRQERVLQFIGEFGEEHGYPPTVRDIQQACEISSTSVVDYNLRIIEREGHIRRSPEVSRGIELLDGGRPRKATSLVPLLGDIAAGQPFPPLAAEDFSSSAPVDTLDVASSMLNGARDVFALRVRGTSMIDALVDDGDIVVIKPTAEARNGEMVVAWLEKEKEATLKRFYIEGDRVRLQPANSEMDPIYVDACDVVVQGTVVAVLRGAI